MTVGGIISAVVLTGIFAYLIARLASAMLKNKLRPESSDYGADPHTAALASKLSRASHSADVTQGKAQDHAVR